VRVISLWQPWAECIKRGLKLYETRGWTCDYRGTIAIHAAKKKYKCMEYSAEFRRQLLMDSVDEYWLKYGVVLCFVDVIGCHPVEDVRGKLSGRELQYGDYSDGRFAWQLENVRVLPKPIELTGRQGFFHWADGDRLLAECS
jgi:hypothetical protein